MKRTSGFLLCCVATLLALGAVMVFSVISARASALDVGVSYLLKHALWVTAGIVGMLILSRLDYHWYEKHRLWIAIVALILLVAVLVPGVGTLKNGAQRWIRLGPLGFQPSELAKVALLIVIASMAAQRGHRMREVRHGLLPCMAVVGVAAGLVILEPDYGTAALIGMMGTLVVLVAGAPLLPIAGAALAGVAGVGFLIWHSPARMGRVVAFLDPWKHHDAAGYQVIHSLMSLGSGGVLGRGLGGGRQKLFYLPEPDTDFIFAIIGEELGLIGAVLVVAIFVILIRQAMRISAKAKDPFGALLALGIALMIALQTLIHIAVVTASMPTKGIALPFVSSGGSSLIVSLLGIGILLNIASQTTEESLGQTGQLLPVEPAIGDTVHSRATASAAGSGG